MVSQSNGELRIIEGALNGLHGLLFSFHQIISNDPNMKKEIHQYARMALQPQSDLSRFGVPIGKLHVQLHEVINLFIDIAVQLKLICCFKARNNCLSVIQYGEFFSIRIKKL